MCSSDLITVNPAGCNTMVAKLKKLRSAIPETMRNNPNLRILMGTVDADTYDEELTAQSFKGSNWTDTNAEKFKGIKIESLVGWPKNLIVATICGENLDTNLWAGCNLSDDEDVILIDKLTNAGERYFFKMLMKMDTQVAFDEEVVWMDARGINVDPATVAFPKEGATKYVAVSARRAYTLNSPTGFTVSVDTEDTNRLKIVAANNSSGSAAKTGTITLTLTADTTKTATISLTQPKT